MVGILADGFRYDAGIIDKIPGEVYGQDGDGVFKMATLRGEEIKGRFMVESMLRVIRVDQDPLTYWTEVEVRDGLGA